MSSPVLFKYLGEQQRFFMRQLPRLIDKAHELGFEATLGDGFRDERSHGKLGERIAYGEAYSCHKVRLAIDLNLFKDLDSDGKLDYLAKTEFHRPLGEWWEAQHPLNCWGGRFQDGNHYSMTYKGMK